MNLPPICGSHHSRRRCGPALRQHGHGAGDTTVNRSCRQPATRVGSPSMNPQMNGIQTNGEASPVDRLFVKNALQPPEVQLGQLTLQKSNNDQVKQFAQKMIDDHTRLGDQMKPVAQQVGVAVPTEPSKKDKQIMAKLQALSGSAYDQAYIKDMVKDHKQDLSEFQMEASSGQDAAVKDAATQGSQLIAPPHLQMAQQLAKDQNINLASK